MRERGVSFPYFGCSLSGTSNFSHQNPNFDPLDPKFDPKTYTHDCKHKKAFKTTTNIGL